MNLNSNSIQNTLAYTAQFKSQAGEFFSELNTTIDSAIENADHELAKDIDWISSKLAKIRSTLKNEILTKNYIVKTSKDFIRAKVKPLSSPPGWAEAMKKATGTKKVMQGVKSERAKLLADIETQMANASAFQKKSLESQRSHLRQGVDEMGENLQALEKYIVYLEKVKKSKISSRFGGYCGTLANFIIPGSGTVVGSINTGLHLVTEEKLAASLPEMEEKRKVRNSTMSSVALSIATLAFTLYALPTLKAGAMQLIKGYI
jgi:hypothetical protein